jgi:hypothetical protein
MNITLARTAGTIAFGVAVLGVVWVGAVPAAAAGSPPLIAGDPARPSAIEITGATSYVLDSRGNLQNVACVVFVNHGPRLATKVGLSLALVDATGTVVDVDVMYPRGKFLVDTRSAFSVGSNGQDIGNGNCHGFGAAGAAARSTFVYRANKNAPVQEVAAILVSAREIVYDDGTAWRTDQVPQTGDHVTLPVAPPFSAAVAAGPPRITTRAMTGSPIELTDAFRYESAMQTGGGPPSGPGLLQVLAALPQTIRSQQICMVFGNRDPRGVKRVRVDLAIVDRTGKIGGIETLDGRGKFAPGTPADDSGSACEGIQGRWDGDTFMYSPAEGVPAFAVSRIVVSPEIVDFADGTTWMSPTYPVVGESITAP